MRYMRKPLRSWVRRCLLFQAGRAAVMGFRESVIQLQRLPEQPRRARPVGGSLGLQRVLKKLVEPRAIGWAQAFIRQRGERRRIMQVHHHRVENDSGNRLAWGVF